MLRNTSMRVSGAGGSVGRSSPTVRLLMVQRPEFLLDHPEEGVPWEVRAWVGVVAPVVGPGDVHVATEAALAVRHLLRGELHHGYVVGPTDGRHGPRGEPHGRHGGR